MKSKDNMFKLLHVKMQIMYYSYYTFLFRQTRHRSPCDIMNDLQFEWADPLNTLWITILQHSPAAAERCDVV